MDGIPRVTGGSEKWLQCDEMWSFVGYKANKQWVWIALAADSREVVTLVVGRIRCKPCGMRFCGSQNPFFLKKAG